MCGLSLAWVTSENSTSNLNADILSRFSSLDPILSATGLRSPVLTAPVRGSTPTLFARLSAVQRQLPLSSFSSQLSFASPSHSRIRRDFMFKNPLSGFAPKQTKESSALAAHPHSATKQPRQGFELGSPIPFPTTIIVTLSVSLESLNEIWLKMVEPKLYGRMDIRWIIKFYYLYGCCCSLKICFCRF